MQYIIHKVKLNKDTGRYEWEHIGAVKDKKIAKEMVEAYNASHTEYHLQILPTSSKIIK